MANSCSWSVRCDSKVDRQKPFKKDFDSKKYGKQDSRMNEVRIEHSANTHSISLSTQTPKKKKMISKEE